MSNWIKFTREHPNTKLSSLIHCRKCGKSVATLTATPMIMNCGKVQAVLQTSTASACCWYIHTRKQPAGDKFEMISGTTGLLGCADGALRLQKEKTYRSFGYA